MMNYCYLCQSSFNYNYSFTWHLKSEKHLALQEEDDKWQESVERSVHVSNFPPDFPTFNLAQCFCAYGPIFSIDVERNRGVYALIEFKEKKTAEQILNIRNHYSCNYKLMVKRYFPKSKPPPPMPSRKEMENNQWTYESIVDSLLALIDITQQMVFLEATLKLTDEELAERRNICQYFNKLYSEYFEFSEVNIFGSTANGLGQHGCDIDMLLSLKPEKDERKVISHAEKSDASTRFILKEIVQTQCRKLKVSEAVKLTPNEIISTAAHIVKKRGEKCSNILVIKSRRCPIVRFNIQRENLLSCDISVKNRLSLYNSKLVSLFMSSDSRIAPLTVTIKYWTVRRNLIVSQRIKLSSYSTALLVIFYLQNTDPPILPAVEDLRRLLRESRVVGGWECNFSEEWNMFPKTKNKECLEDLLRGFFNYYAHVFDFKNYVACPYSGKTMLKENLQEIVPIFETTYISVQDPFDLSHNTTFNIDANLAQKIFQAFSEASRVLDVESPACARKLDGTPWGLISLFDNVSAKSTKDEKNEDNEVELILEPPIEVKNPHKEHHLELLPQISFNILDACEVEELRARYPRISTDGMPDWFYHACKAVHSVLAIGLQFSCTSEDYDPIPEDQRDNSNNYFQFSKRKFAGGEFQNVKKRKSEWQPNNSRTYTQDESWDDGCRRRAEEKALGRFDRFACHVHCRTWEGRKKAANKIERFGCSNLEAEENISKLIVKELSYPDKPLFSFLCKVNMKPLPAVDVTLIALTNSVELKTVAFTFLKNFVPKLLKNMLNSNEIL